MPAIVAADEVLVRLKQAAAEHGMHCSRVDHEGLRGELETVQARWFFGERKVTYFFECRLEEDQRTVHFREVVRATSSGLPVPVITAGKATVAGGTTADAGPGHPEPGPLEYFRVRAAIERTVRDAGWRFRLEAGRP